MIKPKKLAKKRAIWDVKEIKIIPRKPAEMEHSKLLMFPNNPDLMQTFGVSDYFFLSGSLAFQKIKKTFLCFKGFEKNY